jgi:hypothetical protein
VTMRSDGGGATDRRPRPSNSIQWYLHPHSLPVRAVAFQRRSRCMGSPRLLLYSTHSLERTLLLRVQRSATGRTTTCPPHDYRVLPSVTRKEESRPGDEQGYNFRVKNEGSNRYNSRVFTLHRDAFTRAVCSPISRIRFVCSFHNQSELFPSFFFPFSLYFLL